VPRRDAFAAQDDEIPLASRDLGEENMVLLRERLPASNTLGKLNRDKRRVVFKYMSDGSVVCPRTHWLELFLDMHGSRFVYNKEQKQDAVVPPASCFHWVMLQPDFCRLMLTKKDIANWCRRNGHRTTYSAQFYLERVIEPMLSDAEFNVVYDGEPQPVRLTLDVFYNDDPAELRVRAGDDSYIVHSNLFNFREHDYDWDKSAREWCLHDPSQHDVDLLMNLKTQYAHLKVVTK
jgi:hypothetical protein